MKYTVLWFDDMRDYLESIDQEAIKDTISSWGFEPCLILEDDPEQFIAHKPFNGIDLIVVDYNLGDQQPHGEEFIDLIRQHNVLTEVIFYSANPSSQLWDAIRERQLEGVFVSNKEGINAKLENVARQSLRKVLDLNNVRGIIMAEIGDLDKQIDGILRAGMSSLSADVQHKIFTKFVEDAERQQDQRIALLAAFKANPSVDGMIELCDSQKRWDSLSRLRKADQRLKDVDLEKPAADILFPRNCLAHGIPSMSGEDQVFTQGKNQFTYNEESSVALRVNILRYKSKLVEINKLISA